MSGARRTLGALAALLVLAAGMAHATELPPVRVSVVPPDALPIKGQNVTLTFQITSPVAGTLTNIGFRSELANSEDPFSGYWFIVGHDAPPSVAMQPNVPVPIDVTLNPRSPEEPIEISFKFDSQRIRRKVFLLPLGANGLWGVPVLNKSGLDAAPQRDETLANPGLPENPRTDIRDLSVECDPARNPGKQPYVRVRGRVVYFRPDGGFKVGADGVSVRVYDEDDGFDDYLGGQTTDAYGNFDMTFLWNQAESPDIYLEVAAANAKCDVVHPNIWEETYTFTSDTRWNVTSTDMNWNDVAPTNTGYHPALHIVTTVSRAWRELNAVGFGGIPDIDVLWPDDVDPPHYSSDEIHMNAERQWWEYSILHEYGHHFNATYGAKDVDGYCNPGGYADDGDDCGHTSWCPEDGGVAWNEGVAEFFGNYMVDTIIGDWGPTTGTRDHEDIAMCGESGSLGSFTNTEGILTAFLLDVADFTQDTDDDALDNGSDLLSFGLTSILQMVDTYEPVTPVQALNALRAMYPTQTQKLWATAANNGYDFDSTPPTTVTSLSSTSHATTGDSPDGTVDLVWPAATDPESGIDFYRVTITTIGGSVDYDVSGTSWTTPPLDPDTYYFSVQAVNKSGLAGGGANFQPVTIRPATPPDADVISTNWTYPIVPRTTTGSTGGSAPLPGALLGNVAFTYYNYSIGNGGELNIPGTIRLRFYVDGVMYRDHPITNLPSFGQQWFLDIGPDTVRGGRHTLSVFGDATELVSEADETNNYYHRQFIWSPLGFSGDTWTSRPNPPDPWAGFDDVNFLFDSPNCDGFQYSLDTYQFRGVVAVARDVDDDHDIRSFPTSTGPTNGYNRINALASSFRPAGCLDAIFTNNSLTGTDAFQVGVMDFDDAVASPFDIHRTQSVAMSSGVNTQIVVAEDDYLAIRHVNLAGDGYPDYGTLELTVNPAEGPVHAALIDPADVHFGLDDATYEGVTDEAGYLKLDFLYGSPLHGVLVWQDPKDVPSGQSSAFTAVLNVRPKRADLEPYEPAGWYEPVVPSTGSPGTPTQVSIPTNLTGNVANTYFNAAIVNDGQTIAGGQDKLVYLDGVGIVGSQIGQLGPFQTHLSNYGTVFTVQGGRHTVSLRADASSQVTEDDETNNRHGRQYIWSPYMLTTTAGWINRAAPPAAVGGWDDLLATVGFDEVAYFNCDGFRTPMPVINGDVGNWVAVATLPQGSHDVDVRLHEQSNAFYGDFGAIREASGWPGFHGDYVLVNFRDTAPRQFEVGVVAAEGSGSYFLNYAASDYLGANPDFTTSTITLGSNVMLRLHEMWLDPGVIVISLQNHTGTVDWGMTMHRAGLPYQSKSTDSAVSSWLGGPGQGEQIVYVAEESGYYCLAVWRTQHDGSGAARYILSFDGGTATPPADVPVLTQLHPASPNPFNPRTTVRFDLATPAPAELDVYDVRGAHVRTLVREGLEAGRHERVWDGVDDAGRRVSSGVYFVTLRAGAYRDTRKLILVK